MTERERPPHRRPTFTRSLEWNNNLLALSVGFYDDGRACEVFLRGFEPGSDIGAMIDDLCVLMSFLMQSGFGVGEIADHLRRPNAVGDADTASLVGLMAAKAAVMEADEGPAARLLIAAARGQGDLLENA